MRDKQFNKTLLAKTLSMVLGVCAVTPAWAAADAQSDPSGNQAEQKSKEEEKKVEVIAVKGIRGSMARAMDIKREARGVVDAISAEDIGKFPDSNLAESLQRISGVSIDRSNNEGSKVTVRGFGPEFNLVTLNGRQMPGAQLGGVSTRSYDFANIASEGISGVEVYKTGRADMFTGGIGSTINILTAKPLAQPGFKSSFGAKAVMDTSNEVGNDVTPEYSGMISNTFDDDTIGVLLSGSYQKRDSREQNAKVDFWRQNIDLSRATGEVTDNNQNPDGNTWYPRNQRYTVNDASRTRTNGQLVLEYAPNDKIKVSTDYTYAEFKEDIDRDHFAVWFNGGGNIEDLIIDENGTAVALTETGGDYSFTSYADAYKYENKSFGLNVDWQVTDTLNLNFDYHDSSASAGGTGAGNDSWIIMGANNLVAKTFDARNTEIPLIGLVLPEGMSEIGPQDIEGLFGQTNAQFNKTDIKQLRINGKWVNEGDGDLAAINFGYARTEMTTNNQAWTSGNLEAGGYGGDQDLWPDELFTRVSTAGLFDQFSGGDGALIPYYYHTELSELLPVALENYGDHPSWADGFTADNLDSDHFITENTDSVYLQFEFESDFNDMPVNIVGGWRHERTEVIANSRQILPLFISWNNATEWATVLSSDADFTAEKRDYSTNLPSLDMDIEIIEGLKARFSYSRTITRPNLQDMRGTTSVSASPKPGSRTGNAGNPGLLPYTSDNIDLSLEYYYDDSSYVSVGYFSKDVENFLLTETSLQQISGLRDPLQGPRAQQAIADLQAQGLATTDANIFNQIILNGGGTAEGTIAQSADDPLIDWRITQPSNAEDARLDGWELAAQHMFGESGFGFMTNLTVVDGDVEVDVAKVGTQHSLQGLSDSANLVAFYDKDGFQVRIAYNWRDDFLAAYGEEPTFVEDYAQVDISVSYEWNENLTLFVEGLNITDETQRLHGRYEEQLLSAQQFGPRYNVGMRYSF